MSDDVNECPSCGAYVKPDSKKETVVTVTSDEVESAGTESLPAENTAQTENVPRGNVLLEELDKVRNKKPKRFVLLYVIFMVIALVCGLISGLLSDDTDTPSVTPSDNDAPSAAYMNVFDQRGITPDDNLASYTDLSHVAYVCVDEYDYIYVSEFAFSGDVIVMNIDTMYVPVGDMTDIDRAVLDGQTRQDYDDVDALDCAEVRYEMGDEYYKVTVVMENIDLWENIKALGSTEMYAEDVSGEEFYYSIEISEEGLLADGYVKK